MLHRLTALLILLFTFFYTYAQSGGVSGLILDGKSKLPLEGVTVATISGTLTTTTNERGKFYFRNTGNTINQLQITAIGYESKTISVSALEKDLYIITLAPRSIQLKEVTVSGNPADQYKPISQTDIELRGINHSQEVLRMVPGLFIGQHAGGGKAEQIFLRGFDLDHGTDIQITVDGMPVNMVSHAHGQGYADLHFLIPELINKVDFKKGTYYPEKGNFTTTGYVDFKTFNTLSQNVLKAEAGMFNTYRGLAMINLLGKKAIEKQQSAYIAGEYMHSQGYFDNPQDFNRFNVFGKYFGKISPNTNLSFSASRQGL